MSTGLRQISTTVTWSDVAYYFGTLAIASLAFAGRFSDFRQSLIERAGADNFRGILILMLMVCGVFVAIGIVLIVRAARS